jgi:hypothetical protein
MITKRLGTSLYCVRSTPYIRTLSAIPSSEPTNQPHISLGRYSKPNVCDHVRAEDCRRLPSPNGPNGPANLGGLIWAVQPPLTREPVLMNIRAYCFKRIRTRGGEDGARALANTPPVNEVQTPESNVHHQGQLAGCRWLPLVAAGRRWSAVWRSQSIRGKQSSPRHRLSTIFLRRLQFVTLLRKTLPRCCRLTFD